MKRDWNQSSDWPSSSIVCKKPSPPASSPMAIQSMPPLVPREALSAGRKVRHIRTAAMPTGTLMKRSTASPGCP